MKKLVYIIGILSIGLLSCDTIDNPIPEDQGASFNLDGSTEYITDPALNINSTADLIDLLGSNDWDSVIAPDNSNRRFIVIEEFTGHQCIFCPAGTKEMLRLDSIHGDQLIPVSIHAGGFALTTPPKYDTDYRVMPHADAYNREFDVQGYPTGLISRLGATVKSKDNWATSINQIKDDNPIATLRMKNYYAQASNIIRSNIGITFKSAPPPNSNREFSLQVFILEDHIIDWQKDVLKGDIENYDHRFMLRKVVNGTWGRAIPNDGILANEEITFEYILPLNSNWKPDDVSVVAFLFDNDLSNAEIMQANTAKIK